MSTELRTGPDTGDDGFHEIQLNGKQLVFLGMATTLVSVVIFLCGVLVGRGVRPLEPVAEAAAATPPVAESTVAETAPPAVPGSAAPAPEPTPVSDSYYEALPAAANGASASGSAAARAEAAAVPPASAKREAAAPAPRPVAEAKAEVPPPPKAAAPDRPEPKPAAAEVVASTAEVKPVEPKGTVAGASPAGKVAVQVAAFSSRAEAEGIARRLSGKGYAVYVVDPAPGAKPVFRVRVGNYASLDEAQRISSRLAQEEKLKPWIIR